MPTKYFVFVAFLFLQNLYAQQITILDEVTREPISDVAVFNEQKTKSAISDFDGKVNIDSFNKNEVIFFQHTAYGQTAIVKSEIIKKRHTVLLYSETDNLDEIVLSISKFNQKKREISQSVISISAEDALFTQPQTTADLLSNNGRVFVQKSQMGGGSPMIRGFSSNRLLMTVDGVRMNTAIFRGGNIQNILSIDPFIVENTEVILGPGSVVYGSDAVGGVMNFHTLKPKFSFGERMTFSGNAVARFSTANEEKTAHIDVNLGFKKWAFISSITFNDFGDLRMGTHGPDDYLRNTYIETIDGEDVEVTNENPKVQTPTGYNQISLAQKVRFMPDEHWDFTANFLFSTTSDFSRYDRLIRARHGNLRLAEWYYGPQLWFSGNIKGENTSETSFYDSSKIIMAYQKFEESRNNRDVQSTDLFNSEDKVYAFSTNIDFTKNLNSVDLFYGVEYVHNNVNSSGKVTDIESGNEEETASRYPDGSTWQSYAAYSSLLWKISPKVTFQSGARYSHFIIDATFDDRFYDFPFKDTQINSGNLTGSLGLTFQASKILGLRTNVSTAFRAPNIDDIGKIFDSEPGSVVVPNPDLKAEYSYTGEVGANLNFNDYLKMEMATFYTKLDNALVRRDFSLNGETEIMYQGELSNVQAIQNAADARVYGFETSVNILFSENLTLVSNYTIAKGYEILENGDEAPLRHAPPQFGNTHLIWKNKRLKIDAFANYNGQIRAQNLAPSETNKPEIYPEDDNGNLYSPGWHTLNLATQYQLTDAFQLSASLENISDRRYRTYSSGLTAPGRNFIAAVKYTF